MASQASASQQSTAAAQVSLPWFTSSSFFEPMCMSFTTLQGFENDLHFMDENLHVLTRTSDEINLTAYEELNKGENRENFTKEVIRAKPELTIFFISHIFEHQAPEGPDPRKRGLMRFSLGLTQENFQWFMKAADAHPLFLECLHNHVGQCSVYETFDDASGEPLYLHLLIKVPPGGHLEAAFYIRHEYASSRLMIIVAGNDFNAQIKQLQSHLLLSDPPYDPFAIALSIASRYLWFLEAQKIQVDHAVIMTERETGRGAVAYSDGQVSHTISPDKFDLTFMHWIEGNQRNIVYATQFQAQLAQFLVDQHKRYLERIQQQKAGKLSNITTTTLLQDLDLSPAQRTLHSRLLSHLSVCNGLHSASLVIRERIQRQLSAADSIINQYDNKVSLSNAEANTSIAEQSRRIADESKAIATETRRDSTSMKTIASLTMVYLPSTFAASVFSTGFFSYANGGTELVRVNPQIWKLFVVAILLSLLTITVWVWLNKSGVPKWLSWARQKPLEVTSTATEKVPGSSGDNMIYQTGSTTLDDLRTRLNRPPVEVTSAPRISLPVQSTDDMA